MSFREKDFLMRQIQQLIQGFGKMVTLQSVKDFINLDKEMNKLSDEEVERLIVIELLKNQQIENDLSDSEVATLLRLSLEDYDEIIKDERIVTEKELDTIKKNIS